MWRMVERAKKVVRKRRARAATRKVATRKTGLQALSRSALENLAQAQEGQIRWYKNRERSHKRQHQV